jgi:peptide deformylase
MNIVKAPDEILRTPTKPVDLALVGLKKIIAEMTATLVSQVDPEGVGLAANQVNLPYSLFLARFDSKKESPVYVFINPEIVAHSEELQPEEDAKKPLLEGCLSLPNYYGVVKRWKSVKIRYQKISKSESQTVRNSDTLNLSEVTETFEGFPAVVIQHEMDHLNGHIFVEKILEQNGKLFKTSGKNNKERWEEIEL